MYSDIDYLIIYLLLMGTCICLVSVLGLRMDLNLGDASEVRQFRRVSLFLVLQMTVESIWRVHMCTGMFMPIALAYLCNFLDLLFTGLMVYYWFCFLDMLLLDSEASLRKGPVRQWIVRIPVILMLALDVLSLWNHQVFYISDTGTYMRGGLYIVHFLCLMSYYFAVFAVMIRSVRQKNYDHTVFHASLMFTTLPFFGGILQGVLGKAPFTSTFFSFGMLLMFITLQSQQINTDALTQIDNRRCFFRKLQQQVRDASKQGQICLAIIDIDYFKSINDNFSHHEGDRALTTFADVLRKTAAEVPHQTVVARYGGDEFALMCEVDSMEEFRRIGDQLNRNLERERKNDEPYELHCSFGAAMLVEGMTAEQLLSAADKDLYAVKRANHTARRASL